MALHKQTKIETPSLCINGGMWIVVLLSVFIFRSIHAIFQKRSISTKSSDSTCIFTTFLWYNKAQKSRFSRFPFVLHTIIFLLICCLCSLNLYFLCFAHIFIVFSINSMRTLQQVNTVYFIKYNAQNPNPRAPSI